MTRRISLALQGGGAHGAFTWGVLDRLLEEEDLTIAAISGTSAGALNAVAFKAGFVAGGREGARAALASLWAEVGAVGDLRFAPWIRMFLPYLEAMKEISQTFFPISASGLAAQMVSPYAWGSAWQNPLAPILRQIDFAAVRSAEGPRLFVGATNVRTGKVKLFTDSQITEPAVLASACLPTVFQAVEIEGEAYWDGGFSGNPSLFPLYHPDLPDEVVIVKVNPMRREKLPTTPLEIQDRITEIGFNAPLLGELQAAMFVSQLIANGSLERGTMKDVHLHLIADNMLMNDLSGDSKMLPNHEFLGKLRSAGHRAADRFLSHCGSRIGRETTLDLAEIMP